MKRTTKFIAALEKLCRAFNIRLLIAHHPEGSYTLDTAPFEWRDDEHYTTNLYDQDIKIEQVREGDSK